MKFRIGDTCGHINSTRDWDSTYTIGTCTFCNTRQRWVPSLFNFNVINVREEPKNYIQVEFADGDVMFFDTLDGTYLSNIDLRFNPSI